MRGIRTMIVAVLGVVALLGAACGGNGDGEGGDLLAQIKEEGVLTVSTDPAYPPQSSLNEDTGEYEGFDIDVAEEIGQRLGVTVEYETPVWETIIAGNWQGRWDVSVGSMTVTPERDEVLHFVEPYYYTPAAVAVPTDDTTTQDIETDLDGKTIGVCSGCTYDFYLQKTLEIPGEDIEFVIDDAEIKGFDTDTSAIEDLQSGRVDAVISSITTLQEAEKAGEGLRIVGTVFFEPLSVAVDRDAPADPQSLVDEIDSIVKEMHSDGTLSALSEEWFGLDLTTKE